ncbi:MAG: hypothetical protein AAGJ37_00525 [Pseudomonadota bacterium]
MLKNDTQTTETSHVRPSRRRKPDIIASLIIEQDCGKTTWQPYFDLWDDGEGFYKGTDPDGNPILVLTREAKDAIVEPPIHSTKRRPDLFIFIEAEDEAGEPMWDEILVAWKGKKDGTFKTQNAEGQDIILQTREAKAAALAKSNTQRIAASALASISRQDAEDTSKEKDVVAEEETELTTTE